MELFLVNTPVVYKVSIPKHALCDMWKAQSSGAV